MGSRRLLSEPFRSAWSEEVLGRPEPGLVGLPGHHAGHELPLPGAHLAAVLADLLEMLLGVPDGAFEGGDAAIGPVLEAPPGGGEVRGEVGLLPEVVVAHAGPLEGGDVVGLLPGLDGLRVLVPPGLEVAAGLGQPGGLGAVLGGEMLAGLGQGFAEAADLGLGVGEAVHRRHVGGGDLLHLGDPPPELLDAPRDVGGFPARARRRGLMPLGPAPAVALRPSVRVGLRIVADAAEDAAEPAGLVTPAHRWSPQDAHEQDRQPGPHRATSFPAGLVAAGSLPTTAG
jgi:hypothetical protein